MKQIFLLSMFLIPSLMGWAQKIKVSQLDNNRLKISYNTRRQIERVSLYVSTDGGLNYNGPLSISGDTCNVRKGKNKSIIWRVTDNYPNGISGDFIFRLDQKMPERKYYRGFYVASEVSFLSGWSNIGGVGATLGYLFGRWGISVSGGGMLGDVKECLEYPGYFLLGPTYNLTPNFALKGSVGFMQERAKVDYIWGGGPFLAGSLGFMYVKNHFVASLESFHSRSSTDYYGGLKIGLGYLF